MPLSFLLTDKIENGDVYQRRRGPHMANSDGQETESKQQEGAGRTGSSWRRILLLILAITIHNIPGEEESYDIMFRCSTKNILNRMNYKVQYLRPIRLLATITALDYWCAWSAPLSCMFFSSVDTYSLCDGMRGLKTESQPLLPSSYWCR